MNARALLTTAFPEPCLPVPRRALDGDGWAQLIRLLGDDPSLELRAMWADQTQVYALFLDPSDGAVLFASVAVELGLYHALSPARPSAAWFERMIHDLWGHNAANGLDGRPWLDHGNWTVTPPLAARRLEIMVPAEPKEFLPVEGTGLHRIPVGPVHAGIIEPGHFRFTAQGEIVVRLEARLGYLHKGTLGLLLGKSPRAAARFAARLSGDSTVAHAIAFARAAEAAANALPPPRAEALRCVMAEVERIANHLGDIGAIANDAAFALLQARFVYHREMLLRATERAFGHRLMMDAVIPGGVAVDIAPGGAQAIFAALDGLAAEWDDLLAVYDNSSSLADRMLTTGTLAPSLAATFAPGGFVGRASGQSADLRTLPGYGLYRDLDVQTPVLTAGDVDARVRIRMAEIVESTRLVRDILLRMPEGAIAERIDQISGEGIGWAEGFRGDIWHWLRVEGGQIVAAFLCDPSWRQWPLLEVAVEGNIVADFPLCNKSFNCSYSGVDL
jgi:Ni,Fe-hydrogenase III large subunit